MQQETHDPAVLPDLPHNNQDKRPWHAPEPKKFSVSSTEGGTLPLVVEDTTFYITIS